jgi:hypothetical protein
MSGQFGDTAVKLSQGPLGIIALFIAFVYAIAGLVLGLSASLGPMDRSLFVGFLIIFPHVVLCIFGWLVAFHHTKLYHPGAFRNEAVFEHLARYGQTHFDTRPTPSDQQRESAAPPGALDTGKPATLYWLGHDLMWAADALLRQAPPREVIIGLEQAQHHLIETGLEGTPIAREMAQLKDLVSRSEELTTPVRDAYASQLGSIIDRIGIAAEAAQVGFKKPPYWSRVRA